MSRSDETSCFLDVALPRKNATKQPPARRQAGIIIGAGAQRAVRDCNKTATKITAFSWNCDFVVEFWSVVAVKGDSPTNFTVCWRHDFQSYRIWFRVQLVSYARGL